MLSTSSQTTNMQVFCDIDGTCRQFRVDETRLRCADCGWWFPPNRGYLPGSVEFVCETCQVNRWMAEYD